MIGNVFLGSEFLLYDIDNNAIALSKNCALKVKQSLIDVSTKDSQNWSENIVGIKDWSIDFEGLVSYDVAKFNTSYFLSKLKLSESFFVQFGAIQSGFTHTFWGEVAIESIDMDSENGEIVSYSGNLKGISSLEFTNNGTPAQSGYLKTETDPVFRGSVAFNITNTNKNDWFEAYNKSLSEVAFSTTGNQTTLNLKLRDGSVYSSAFMQVGGTGSTGLDQNLFYTKTISDSRFQPIGNYVGNQYLSDYFYNKTESDNKYYLKTNPDGFITSTSLNGLASESWVLGKNYLTSYTESDPIWQSEKGNYYTKSQADGRFHPLQNQSLNTFNSVVFEKIKATNELLIPSSSSSVNGSIWISGAGSSGSTVGGSGSGSISFLDDLTDVSITSATSGQALIYNGSGWINQNVVSSLANYNTKTEDSSLFYPLVGNPSAFITSANLSPYALKDGSNMGLGSFAYRNSIAGNEVYTEGNQSSYDIGVAKVLRWKNYGNGHLIFDASQGTSPSGSGVDNTNSQISWNPTYPTLMGWNGGGTFGVRVDSSRVSDIATNFGGNGADFTSYGTSLSALTGFDSTAGLQKPFLAGQVQSWLGLGSNAYQDYSLTHRYGGFGTDANTIAEHTSSFSYANNAPYVGTLMHFGAENYGTQFSSAYGNNDGLLAFRTRNGDAHTWNTWYQVWTSAQFTPSLASAPSTVVQRDNNGYIHNSYINTTDDVQTNNLGYILGKTTTDNYHRSFTAGAVQSFLGLGANAYQSKTNLSQYTNDLGNYGGFLYSDGATYAGFAGNNVVLPYIKHTSSNTNVYLAIAETETLQSVTNRGQITTNRLQARGGSGTAYNSANLELMGNGRQPTLGFHWESTVASVITIEASGAIAVMNNPGTSYENFKASTISASADLNVTARATANEIKATSKMIIPTSAPSSPENGSIWIG